MVWLFTGGVGEFGRLETLVLGTAGSRDASLNSDLDLSLGGPFKFSTCYSRLGDGFLVVTRRDKDPENSFISTYLTRQEGGE